jgi:hypothetical protein
MLLTPEPDGVSNLLFVGPVRMLLQQIGQLLGRFPFIILPQVQLSQQHLGSREMLRIELTRDLQMLLS